MSLTTGQSLYNSFQEQSGFPYTGYMSPAQANVLFERCFIKAMSDIFVSQQQNVTNKDSLNTLVNTNLILGEINNNCFYVEPLQINNLPITALTGVDDFLNYTLNAGSPVPIVGDIITDSGGNTGLIIEALTSPHQIIYIPQIGTLTTTAFTTTSGASGTITVVTQLNVHYATVRTFLPHNLVNNDTVIISGIQGITQVNGERIAAVVDQYNFIVLLLGTPVGTWTTNSGTVVLVNGQIYFEDQSGNTYSDYWRFLAVKTKYYLPINSTPQIIKWGIPLYITGSTGAGVQIQVLFNNYNSIRTGDNINISGITGNTNANADCFIQMINPLSGLLFSDKNLTLPITGNGAFGGRGIVSRIFYNYAKPYLSDEKISALNDPTARNPKYETANSLIKLYPVNYMVSEVTIDYIRRPYPIYQNLASPSLYPIECTDSTINLEDYYPLDFLYMIKDIAVNTWLSELRDQAGVELNTQAGT